MTMDAGYQTAASAIDAWGDADVTAVICADDLLAFGVMRAAQERDVAVPGAISIAGFNDMPYAGMVTPSLTSVDLRARDLGLRTAVLLSELLNGVDPSWGALQPRLSVRESTGPVP
jgi:LacI family transcriptional regulator